jgi:hypothetical protein
MAAEPVAIVEQVDEPAQAVTQEATTPIAEVVLETVSSIVSTLFITAIGVAGSWLAAKIAKTEHLRSIESAMAQVIEAAKITVGELQQTVVEKYKAAGGGKLTEAQKAELVELLKTKTLEKLSDPANTLLKAAAVDVQALITGAGESWINKIKNAA